MMSAVTIQQMADRVAALLQDRLGVKGKDLAEKLRRAGRRLPTAIRAEARYLDTAAAQAQNPRLMVQIDDARVAEAYDACVKYLNGVNRAARRRALLLNMLTSVAFSLFAVGLLLLAFLYWRGLI
jgi:hypothetical protein